jgi:hypothetical protein
VKAFARSVGYTAALAVVVACLVAATLSRAGSGVSPQTGLIQGTVGSIYKTASTGRSAG